MIRRLQKKFIMISMCSVAAVMLLVIGLINVINFYQKSWEMDEVLNILAENEGQFPETAVEIDSDRDFLFQYQMTAETQFETRYFVVETDLEGTIREVDMSHIAAISTEQAEEYAGYALNRERTQGFRDIYRYKVVENPDGFLLIFVDFNQQINTIKNFLILSFGIASASVLIIFILIFCLSKKIMKPIIEGVEKQKQFITDAGHEIKTPLAIISANSDVLELTIGKNEWVTGIRKQTDRLDTLVKDLLSLSRLDEENVELIFSDFPISDVVEEEASSFETIADTQKKTFELNIQPGLFLYGDENSIRKLVSILVDNGVKYANEGGEIKVTLSRSGKSLLLEVYNTGTDIPQKNLDKLFDRFYRADFSRSRETGGYGIGLSIAWTIVETHKGKISVRNEDKSICFKVILPNAIQHFS